MTDKPLPPLVSHPEPESHAVKWRVFLARLDRARSGAQAPSAAPTGTRATDAGSKSSDR